MAQFPARFPERTSPLMTAMQTYTAMRGMEAQEAEYERMKKAAIMERLNKVLQVREAMGPRFASRYAEQIGAPQMFAQPMLPASGEMAPPAAGALGGPTGGGLEPAFLPGSDQLPFAATRAMHPSRSPQARHQQYQRGMPAPQAGALAWKEYGRQPVGPAQAGWLQKRGVPGEGLTREDFAKLLPQFYKADRTRRGTTTGMPTFSNMLSLQKNVGEAIEGRIDIMKMRLDMQKMAPEEAAASEQNIEMMKMQEMHKHLGTAIKMFGQARGRKAPPAPKAKKTVIKKPATRGSMRDAALADLGLSLDGR